MAGSEQTSDLAGAAVGTAEPTPQLSKGEQIEAILRGESAAPKEPEGTPAPAEPTEAPRERAPITLKGLADQLGVDQTELYRELKISVADGEELSLEDIKGRYKDTSTLENDRKAVIKLRGELEADRIAQLRELAALKAGDQPTFDREYADRMSRERESMLRSIPEWSDPAVITAERKQLQDYLADNGGWPANAIDQIENHRLFVTLRQAMKDRAELDKFRAEKAKAEQPRQKTGIAPRAGNGQTPGQRIGTLKTAVTKGQMSSTEAINRILQGR